MALTDDHRIAAAAENRLLTLSAKIGGAFGVPIICAILVWAATTLVNLNDRMSRVETKIADKLDDAYPRPEAASALGSLGQRIDGIREDVDYDRHRLNALEDRADRPR